MREVSVTDLEQAFNDLYKAVRLSVWIERPYLYDIDGTAEIIANAVAELAEKRNGVQKAVTNADLIRSMTDEELAEKLAIHVGCNKCPGWSVTCGEKCTEYWLKWLRQKADEGEK